MPDRVLSLRELNRATLARQMLLARADLEAFDAVERLAGLQAQAPNAPYIGLWTRLQSFRHEHLTQLVEQRQVVRATLQRATLHLTTARNYLCVRNAIQPALTRSFRSFFREDADQYDLTAIVGAARAYVSEAPRDFTETREHLSGLFPDLNPRGLGYAVRMHLPLVQVPPGGTWGYFKDPRFALAEEWLGGELAPEDRGKQELVRSYLRAFGPATRRDIEQWSALTGLQPMVDELMLELVTYRDERKRVLLDLPNMSLPDPDVPAPVRFLPEFDNLLLSHVDRTRVLPEQYRKRVFLPAARVLATFLVDGFVAGTWRIEKTRKAATLFVESFEPLPGGVRDELAAEGERLVRFVAEDAPAFYIQIAVAD